MEFVKIEQLDPFDYIAALEGFASALPSGARAFATDPDHYNRYSEHCVKDLRLERISYVDEDDAVSVTLDLRFNDLGLADELRIVYRSVSEFALRVDDRRGRGLKRLSDLILDEILPTERGASHEIAFCAGTIWVVCEDLEAIWSAPSEQQEPEHADPPDEAS